MTCRPFVWVCQRELPKQAFRRPMLAPLSRKLHLFASISFAALAANLSAHNLDTTSTALQYSADFIETMKTRAAAGQALVQPGDEFWVSMKTTPGPGTTTGVGGYMTFYVPSGYQVADAAYVLPSATDPGIRTSWHLRDHKKCTPEMGRHRRVDPERGLLC